MSTITTKDGTEIYYKDWGKGPVVTFSHGWPLSSDAWDGQMLFLAQNGFRVVAHDRRGHGRSSQASSGNDMNGYADDLAAVIEALDLKDATLVGHSTGGGEVARYIGRHGTKRVAKAVLIAAVPPIMLKSAANPEGPADGGVRQHAERHHQGPLAILQGPGATCSTAPTGRAPRSRRGRWISSGSGACRLASRTLTKASRRSPRPTSPRTSRRFDVPTLVMHGEDDQIVPVKDSAVKIGEADQGREGNLLSGRAARHHGHASGSGQRGPADLP